MKARLAKKIIKASDFYGFYSLTCRGIRRKPYPYWFKRWGFRAGWMYASKGTKVKHRRVLYWLKSYDMRLDEAIRRLPKYTQALSDAVEAKLWEKRNRLHKMLERVIARQNFKEENSNENVSSSIDGKMECL